MLITLRTLGLIPRAYKSISLELHQMRPRDILNKITWDKRLRIQDFTVTFIHRGVKGDKKTIPYESITKVGKSWFLYRAGPGETLIPFHRILEVKNVRKQEVLWKKKSKGGET